MKKLIVSIFKALHILIIILYLSVCLTPYLSPSKFWVVSLAGLVFPFLLALVLLFFAGWLFANWRWSIISLVALLLSWQQLSVIAGYCTHKSFNYGHNQQSLRVLSWNVSAWGMSNKYPPPEGDNGALTYELIQKQNADILCFQEFSNRKDEYSQVLNIEGIKALGYPYSFYAESFVSGQSKKIGVAIFSKYPFADTVKFSYGDKDFAEHLIYADVKFNQQVVRVFTTHLQSVRFEDSEYDAISKIKKRDGTGLTDSKVIAKKLRLAYQFREGQAKLVKEKIDESPYPAIVCGDFNDVPNSFTYFTIRDNLQDAFLKKGSGIGRTFRFLSPTLRIDYILADKKFEVDQYNCLHVPYSDHYPILADISITPKK